MVILPFDFLEPPLVPPEQLAQGILRLRYEDITQDGGLALSVLLAGLGASVWAKLLSDPAGAPMRERGEIPILSRLVVAAGEGPISVAVPLAIEGRYRFAHVRQPSGEVDRILVEMWASARAPRGTTQGPTPAPDAGIVTAGRLYSEHVLTRLFASKEDRKVRRMAMPGVPEVPPPEVPLIPPARTATLPEGARSLGAPTSAPVAFGLGHTDSNQHVNSLVYLRIAEDAALVHLASLGHRPALALASAEVSYRKPSFAGDRLSVVLSAFEATVDGKTRLGVYGAFVEDGEPLERGRTFVRLRFR